MDLEFSPDEEGFRAEVKAFLRDALSEEDRRAARLSHANFTEPEVMVAWAKRLHRAGWMCPAWPARFGGPEWSVMKRYIFEQECALADAPPLHTLGMDLLGPVLMKFGTQEQQERYLPRILDSSDYWCQGYSEPGSGSDLASLRTQAVREGDHYVVNGAKIWTTHAQHANRMFALVRTAKADRKHDGITFLLLDMDTPGISIRPLVILDGVHELNEVTFADVRVPAENVVGGEGNGWNVAKYLLEFERGNSFFAARWRRLIVRAARLLQERRAEDRGAAQLVHFERRLAEIAIDLDALEMLELGTVSSLYNGQDPGAAVSVMKLRTGEVRQAIDELCLDLLGEEALAWSEVRPLYKLPTASVSEEDRLTVLPSYTYSRAWGIFSGTTEIQLNIIARQIAGL